MSDDLIQRLRDNCLCLAEELERLREELDKLKAQQAQEPVGHVYRYGKDSHGREWHGIHWYDPNLDVPTGTLLYTTPQKAQAQAPVKYGEDNDGWYVESNGNQVVYGLTEEQARMIAAWVNAAPQPTPDVEAALRLARATLNVFADLHFSEAIKALAAIDAAMKGQQ